jgi:sugar phosphate isomerase/epimerase
MRFPPVGLSLFSFGYLGGFTRRDAERAEPVISVEQVMAVARAHGLAGVELPLVRCFPGLPEGDLARLRRQLEAAGLFLTVDAEVVEKESLEPLLRVAARFGESFVRVKLSTILGGNRYQAGLSAAAWFEATHRRLERVVPLARQYGVVLAIENHQDVTSAELVRLIDAVGADALGVNFDTGSTLATCEEPVAFATAVAPYLRNVHLKDYQLFTGPEGFRLVRCALGRGVVDVAGIFGVIARAPHAVRASIELGAVVAREVHWLKPDYWAAYPSRTVGEALPFFRLLGEQLRPDGADAWRTPWEQAAGHAELERVELEEVFSSIEFLKSLGVPARPGLQAPLRSLTELPVEAAEGARAR